MARLGDVCEIVTGSTPKSGCPEYWNGDINWVTPAELTDDIDVIYETQRKITRQAVIDSSLKSFPCGTVLLSSRAPIGKVAIAGTEMYCNQGFKNLICSDKIYNRYLFHFLRSKTQYLNSLGRGATFKEISKSIVADIEIPLPPLDEQRKIATVLDKISDLTAKRRRQLDKLDELVQSRFVEMFGDPVCNTQRLPQMAMTDLCTIIDGDRGVNYPKQEDFLEEGYCLFLNAKNVTSNGFSFKSCMFISKEKNDSLRAGKLVRGDVVLTTRGTVGNLAFYDDSVAYDNIRINSGMVILRMKPDIMSERFFIEQFKMQLQVIKTKITNGSAQPQLPISIMNKIVMIVPLLELQKSFGALVAKVNKEKSKIRRSLTTLETLKKSLMQEYFSVR